MEGAAVLNAVPDRPRTPASPQVCAHTGQPAVYQRAADDCLICAVAMLTGRPYEAVVEAALALHAEFPPAGPMSHSMMRGVATGWGFVLLSGIHMLWDHPAIIGVISPTRPGTGHAVFWDGRQVIDPEANRAVTCGEAIVIDRAYIDRFGLEFTQRASDLAPLIGCDLGLAPAARAVTVEEAV
jgi:hypothetical protein